MVGSGLTGNADVYLGDCLANTGVGTRKGDDLLMGFGGHDNLDGGSGDETLIGGNRDD